MRATTAREAPGARVRSGGGPRIRLVMVLVLVLAVLTPAARGATYPYSKWTDTGATAYTVTNSLSFTGTRDDGTATVTLPFSFNLYGHAYGAGTTLVVSTNGVLEFGDSSASFSNESLPTAVFAHPAILPYWTDFDLTVTYDPIPAGGGEGAAWGISGAAPSRVLAIRWRGYKHATIPESRISFEVALHEGSNEIDMRYFRDLTDPMANGSTATIGIQEGGTAGAFFQHSHNSASIQGSGYSVADHPAYPVNTAHAVVSGAPGLGQTLSVSTGSWSGGPDSFHYQWERCTDSACGTWQDIAGATGSTYVVQPGDVDHRLFALVSASNGWGTSGWYVAEFVGPIPPVPASGAAPVVTGQAQVGSKLATSTGSWNGSPVSYEYQWFRCPSSCSAIAGEAASTYSVTIADLSTRIYSNVRAHNNSGWSSWAKSGNGIGPITPAPPRPDPTQSPRVSGDALVGATLTTTAGGWLDATDSFAYQWLRCVPVAGGGCVSSQIAGATAASYVTGTADVGARVFATVSAHNAGGWSASVSSAAIGPIRVASGSPGDPGDESGEDPDGGSSFEDPGGGSTTPSPLLSRRGTVSTSLRGKTVIVSPAAVLACPAGRSGCTVTVAAQTRAKSGHARKTITIARTSLKAAAGTTLNVTFRLNAKGAKLLRAKKRLSVKVTLAASAGTRAPVKLVMTIAIKQPKPARRS